jgi:hypothetical protein
MKEYRMRTRLLVAMAIAAVMCTAITAQEKPAPAPAETPIAGRTPLKVQFVLSRYQGDKRVSSLPYILGVLSNGQKTSLRMGIQVPISNTSGKGPGAIPNSSYQYKDLGTNIDCQASNAGNGQFNLVVTISDSMLFLDPSATPEKQHQQIVRDAPAFRSFTSSFAMLLRDGQTMQYASATDAISGEVMKIDVTLTLAK